MDGFITTVSTIIMGLVEGITEFLPISSTGHLILTGYLLDFDRIMGSKEAADAFEVVIQFGAILAVVAAFPGRFLRLLPWRASAGLGGVRGLFLLFITSLPAGLLALAFRHQIKDKLFSPLTVGLALAAGAMWISAVETFRPRVRTEGLDQLTWKEALAMGLFQCLALWPGMSRSASTILGGMMSGVERKTATEYSFLAAVPLMTAASAFEFYKCHHLLSGPQLQIFALGFVVAFISAWAAVKLFIRFVSRHTLMPFAWYRLVLAAVVIWWLVYRAPPPTP